MTLSPKLQGLRSRSRLRNCFTFAAFAFAAILASAAEKVLPRMLLLDGAIVGENAVVAVGECGTILYSTDNAKTWQSAATEARATLTGISFAPQATPPRGWAVGHDALILASSDGGHTWAKQYQGENLQDSFLDVLALDAQHVIAVGAYGLYTTTTDGGRTWTRRKLSEDDFHFNRVTRGPSGTLYLAGERGTLFRSTDRGATWTPMPTTYEGSFYGVLPLDRTRLLAHGLRGRLYRTIDDGQTWEQVTTPQPTLIAASLKMKSNYIVLGGQARGLLVSRDYGRTFSLFPEFTSAVAELIELADGTVLVLGEAGAAIISVTASGQQR